MSAPLQMPCWMCVRCTLHDGRGRVLMRDAVVRYRSDDSPWPAPVDAALAQASLGDRVRLTLEPDEAYGHRRPGPGPQPVPRRAMPDHPTLHVGTAIAAETADGEPTILYVVRVGAREVFVDESHPFAGETVEFDIEVIDAPVSCQPLRS